MAPNKLHEILKNRYYIGYVTWRGLEYEGKHEPLIDPETFARVQETLLARRTATERSYRRDHFLVGSLRCGRCDGRLLFTVSSGRSGREYRYFYCSSRVERRPCGLRYLPAAQVEAAVERQWLAETISVDDLDAIRRDLLAELQAAEADTVLATEKLQRRLQEVQRQRLKWAEKAMDGVVPDDIAAEKQRQLAAQLTKIETDLAERGRLSTLHADTINHVIAFLDGAGEAYGLAADPLSPDESGVVP